MFRINNFLSALGPLMLIGVVVVSIVSTSTFVFGQSDVDEEKPPTTTSEKYYILHYKISQRVGYIEKPPATTATSTPMTIDNSTNLQPNRETSKVDENVLTRYVSHDVRARIIDQTCVEEALVNRASFTVCNDEDRSLIFSSENKLRHATLDALNSNTIIEPGRCETLYINGDDRDLQFDCSGIFGIVFKVRLQPENQEHLLPVPIRTSLPPK